LINSDITVYAVWAYDTNDNDIADILEDKYRLTVLDSYAVVSGNGVYLADSEVTVAAGYRQGYTFTAWTFEPELPISASTNENLTFKMPKNDLSIKPNWQKNEENDTRPLANTGDTRQGRIYLFMLLAILTGGFSSMLYFAKSDTKVKYSQIKNHN